LKKPSSLLLMSEWRWMVEFGMSIAAGPALLRAKRGDGHPVLVLPGLLAGDRSTELLRGYLRALGHDAHGWELGSNFGGARGLRQKLHARLNEIANATGRRVSLVGWSLGGIYARELALDLPSRVRYVITLGSPFANDLSATNAQRVYEWVSGETLSDVSPADRARLGGPLDVPTTSMFTKTDGIVNWRTSLLTESERAENVEVLASHLGLGLNPAVLWAIADRLAQPEGTFVPFDRLGPFSAAYPRGRPRFARAS
jgi:pimeloyl-ACP methyl ester carboxylesterase